MAQGNPFTGSGHWESCQIRLSMEREDEEDLTPPKKRKKREVWLMFGLMLFGTKARTIK